jgi:hypothetical protein
MKVKPGDVIKEMWRKIIASCRFRQRKLRYGVNFAITRSVKIHRFGGRFLMPSARRSGAPLP